MPLTDLSRTKLHLIGLEGHVTRHAFGYAVETPRVPTFFFGTCLILDEPPTTLEEAVRWHGSTFGDDVAHRLLVWGGEGPSATVREAALSAGYETDVSTAMAMDAVPAAGDTTGIRVLTPDDWDRIEALSIACDASDADDGDPQYRVFLKGMRALYRSWIEAGSVNWWGVFLDNELVGQCGFAVCDSEAGTGLGRYQAVEVHPDHRRQGIAGRLVHAVARHGFLEQGCQRLILEADGEGPALGLYTRLGFRCIEEEHSLLWSRSSIHVRAEGVSDHADVRALSRLVSGDDELADQLAQLRRDTRNQSWIADRDGKVLGHLAIRVLDDDSEPGKEPRHVVESLVVRPTAAGSGVEEALLEHLAEACRSTGAD